MKIPVSDELFSDHEFQPITVELEVSHIRWLQAVAEQRDVSIDQVVRYLLNAVRRAASDTASEADPAASSTGPAPPSSSGGAPSSGDASSAKEVEASSSRSDADGRSRSSTLERLREAQRRLRAQRIASEEAEESSSTDSSSARSSDADASGPFSSPDDVPSSMFEMLDD